MTVVARSIAHRAALLMAAAAIITLPACGAGQISQTASQVAVVSGAHAQSGPLALRDVRVVLPAENAAPGKTARAALAFSVINTSASTADKLRQIAVSGARATIQPPAPELKPGQTVRALTLAEQRSALARVTLHDDASGGERASGQNGPQAESSQPKQVLVELTDITTAVAPGLNVRVTFSFDKADLVTFEVPVELEQAVPNEPKPADKPKHH